MIKMDGTISVGGRRRESDVTASSEKPNPLYPRTTAAPKMHTIA
jgi:hypothetical protein